MNNSMRSLVILASIACTASHAQWVPFNHPGYSSIFSITTTAGAIYMVSYTNGVIKTVDNGNIWTPMNAGLPSAGSVESVYYNGVNLYTGTHSGVYRSTDLAGSWSIANTGLPTSSTTNFADEFFHYNGATFAIYSASIGNGGGVWRTNDNGDIWYSGNGGLSTNMIVYQVAEVGGILYAATSTGLYYSTNLAVSWSAVSTPQSNFACYAVQGTPGNLVIISTFGYRRQTGTTWTTASTGAPSNPTGGELILYDGKYWAITGSSPGDVLRSVNGGATWTVYETGMVGADVITQYAFHAGGTTLYMGALSKLYGHPGTTTAVEEGTTIDLPVPYPTVFDSEFTVDLTGQIPGLSLVLVDAAGREMGQRNNLPAEPVRIERGTLPAGTYRVLLVDADKGTRRLLGSVVAQ